ncbi:TniQ family protein [Idiomarina abyssalis]|uniref:TniQ family protein n=1 Tax=Idiomarina abyssalis TaxID=86102 RepID=UPI003A91D100
MVYPNARREGNQTHLEPWPIRTRPLDDELLTSWLIRTSFDNFSSPKALTNYIFKQQESWCRDLDRQISSTKLPILSALSNVNEQSLTDLTLKPLISRTTNATLSLAGAWPWLLARRSEHSNTYRSLSFCPVCLAGDSKPYFRRKWRLSFVTVCIEHNCHLRDRCPHCQQSIEPHLLKKKELSTCAHCLKNISSFSAQKADPDVIENTSYILNNLYNETQAASQNLFSELDYLIGLLRRISAQKPETQQSLFKSVVEPNDLSVFSSCRRFVFDYLSVNERYKILKYALRLLSLGFEFTVRTFWESGLPMGAFRFAPHKAPPLILELFGQYTNNNEIPFENYDPNCREPFGPRSRLYVERQWQFFLRRNKLD